MKIKKIEGIKISLYTDAEEYVKDFFEIPDGAFLDTTNLPKSAGFACVEDNEIWIYKGSDCSFEELLSTVAHELGHLVEGGFKKNPPNKVRYNAKHELKAIHYENFVLKSYRIASILFKIEQ